MRIEEIQFGGMLTMALLTLTLAFLLPIKTALGNVFSRARWLMAGATSLLFIQFLLQYTLHFRAMGVTQAVFVNLLFFVPCVWQVSVGVLYLQRNGNILRHEWLAGIAAYAVLVAVLLTGGLMNGNSLLDDTPEIRIAEYVAASIFSVIQLYYSWLNMREFRRLRRALNNFYDYDKEDLLRWMERSVLLLSLGGIFAPFTIFTSGLPLLGYSIFIFLGMYYCIFSFICYGVSNAPLQVQVAEESSDNIRRKGYTEKGSDTSETESQGGTATAEDLRHVALAVDRWLKTGGHLKSGITIKTAASEMNIPRHQFTAWLKTTDQELFNPWLTHLRIEEAKRQLKNHPDWSNDFIAQTCGFSSRSYFQNVFRKQTGLTPAQFASKTT